ncbi:SAM-dependent methyltransferase [Streptomyces thermolineatus]|uniref:SAM-dependent methyltransferase n=1 Tax=Streptomyces thermolineatus TaxID=44033 RepID=A0ABP5ZZ19_9ACTN
MRIDPGAPERAPVELNTDRPHSARIYDYHLGGKTNYPADRESARAAEAAFPLLPLTARINRAFMHRAVARLAREEGIRQFLDVGTGIPTAPNLHETVQAIAPDARVVYADNDPIVLAHAQALLTGTPEGRTAYVDGDARDPKGILGSPELTATLDLDRPVALSLVALLHFVSDEDGPRGIVAEFMDALAPGSFLVLSHVTADFSPQWAQALEAYKRNGTMGYLRTRDEVARFFDGLEMVEPGLVPAHTWHPEPGVPVPDTHALATLHAGVARKR